MGELQDRMVRDMMVRNLTPNTIEAYVHHVRELAKHYMRAPDVLLDEEIRAYQYHLLHERRAATSTCSQARCALIFFYRYTAPRPNIEAILPAFRVSNRLPELLGRGEVERILEAAGNPRNRLILMFAYGSGVRLSEIVHVRLSDLDLERRMIRVEQGKGRKDRYTVLPCRIADALDQYVARYAVGDSPWLFPARRDRSRPMDKSMVQKAYNKARQGAGVSKRGGIHLLRHAFATHALEDGMDLPTLSRMLGHRHVTTTMRYLHLTEKRIGSRVSPLDRLTLDCAPPSDRSPE